MLSDDVVILYNTSKRFVSIDEFRIPLTRVHLSAGTYSIKEFNTIMVTGTFYCDEIDHFKNEIDGQPSSILFSADIE